jgi:hypothetical protein
MLCAALSCGTGWPANAQGTDPLPIASRRLVQSYTDTVDASFTRLGASWSAVGVLPALPCRVLAQPHVRPLLDELWAGSVTFRQHCRRLSAAGAVVLLHGASAAETVWNAESRIGLQGDGRVMAPVRVRVGRESVEDRRPGDAGRPQAALTPSLSSRDRSRRGTACPWPGNQARRARCR